MALGRRIFFNQMKFNNLQIKPWLILRKKSTKNQEQDIQDP